MHYVAFLFCCVSLTFYIHFVKLEPKAAASINSESNCNYTFTYLITEFGLGHQTSVVLVISNWDLTKFSVI